MVIKSLKYNGWDIDKQFKLRNYSNTSETP